nr:PREDICTED: uncharacterized protein LOC109041534 [Bemisia tabaci]
MAIRKLAEDCGFEKLRDSLIRDRIIIGIHNVQLRELLLGEELPLEKVVSLCLSVEVGKKRSDEVNQPKASSVDLVNSGRFQSNLSNQGNNFAGQGRNNNLGQGYNHQNRYNSPNQQQPSRIIDCRSCGQQHPVRQCPAYRQQCKKCLGRNHFQKMCRINEVICPENSAPSVHLDEVEASEYVYISEISCIPHNYRKLKKKKSGGAVRPCGIIATINRVCARPGNSHTNDETRATCQSRPPCFECVRRDLAIINVF